MTEFSGSVEEVATQSRIRKDTIYQWIDLLGRQAAPAVARLWRFEISGTGTPVDPRTVDALYKHNEDDR
jgi:hypothetical protein